MQGAMKYPEDHDGRVWQHAGAARGAGGSVDV